MGWGGDCGRANGTTALRDVLRKLGFLGKEGVRGVWGLLLMGSKGQLLG